MEVGSSNKLQGTLYNSVPAKTKELLLPRFILGKTLAARTGHGDFADYHERFNHEDASLHCRCGARYTSSSAE